MGFRSRQKLQRQMKVQVQVEWSLKIIEIHMMFSILPFSPSGFQKHTLFHIKFTRWQV